MADVMAETLDDFGQAALTGLSQKQKTMPARFFYDDRGSALFEEITRLPEYYVTRAETALLKTHADEIARHAGAGRPVVEFGAGSATKTPTLLRATEAPVYVPIDISGDFLLESMETLGKAVPGLQIVPLAGDFTEEVPLPSLDGPVTGFFPGSTIGNFDHARALDLLRQFRRQLGTDARLVIGMDTRKNPRMLEAAYDDSAGVTAAFNLNLLERMNRELDGTIPVDAFEHRAIWHDALGRIEMHLVATRAVTFRVAGRTFSMEEGESIHTENSHKYTLEEARLMARASGWEPRAYWSDNDATFGVHVWAAMPDTMQP
ncbi:L-histidine N(alpha)-methyltransferase [Novosphingobium malaysiense]|uniref:Methyltransferase n=1 Tax=Novosphingobium malaysiense TaxID=1348853 RepID=A0A0B1ZJN1_9SPHN|nr:L-histidine N(alpha)-methyltransferase [Novosphingobium malaysiense]KHK90733.1 methyltransferase [Novosphingobium malaysiense]